MSQLFAKVLELQLQHQSFQWIFRVNFLSDWLVGSPCSPRDSQESSPTPQFESINSSVLRLLYGPNLISIHDYWKSHTQLHFLVHGFFLLRLVPADILMSVKQWNSFTWRMFIECPCCEPFSGASNRKQDRPWPHQGGCPVTHVEPGRECFWEDFELRTPGPHTDFLVVLNTSWVF